MTSGCELLRVDPAWLWKEECQGLFWPMSGRKGGWPWVPTRLIEAREFNPPPGKPAGAMEGASDRGAKEGTPPPECSVLLSHLEIDSID